MAVHRAFFASWQSLLRLVRHGNRRNWTIFGAFLIFVFAGLFYNFYGVKVESRGLCNSLGYPIKITVTNNTFRRLPKVYLQLEGWRDGMSRKILYKSDVTFDRVVNSFGSEVLCYPDRNVRGIDIAMGKVQIVVKKVKPVFY